MHISVKIMATSGSVCIRFIIQVCISTLCHTVDCGQQLEWVLEVASMGIHVHVCGKIMASSGSVCIRFIVQVCISYVYYCGLWATAKVGTSGG